MSAEPTWKLTAIPQLVCRGPLRGMGVEEGKYRGRKIPPLLF